MMETKFSALKKKVQVIIDCISQNKKTEANQNLIGAHELLDEILDHTADDQDLIEISRYQVLLKQLQHLLVASN
jgi:hypothetical protein